MLLTIKLIWFGVEALKPQDVEKPKEGDVNVPAGTVNAPVMTSPVFNTLPVAYPTSVAVMEFAMKLPDESRAAIALLILEDVAVVAEFTTLPGVAMMFSLVSEMEAESEISLFVMREDDNVPLAAL